MKGLLRKERYLLRTGTGLLMLIASTLFAVAGGIAPEVEMIQCFTYLYIPLGVFSVMGMEEKWRWNAYVQCAPVTRFQMVLAKYIITLGQILVNTAIFSILNLCIHGGASMPALFLLLPAILVTCAVMYPLIFRLGANNGWLGALFCVVILGGMGAGAAAAKLESFTLNIFDGNAYGWLLLLGGLGLFAASCPLSARLYAHRK